MMQKKTTAGLMLAELMASTDPEVRQFVRGEPDGPVKFHYPAADMDVDFGVTA